MLTILLTAAIGVYIGNRLELEFRVHPEEAFFSIAAPALPTDILWFWTSLLFVCTFAVTDGRKTRTLARTVRPWLEAFGVNVPALPTLPQVPRQLTA